MTQKQYNKKINDNWLLSQLRKALSATGNGQRTSLYIDMKTGKTTTLTNGSHFRAPNMFHILSVEHFLGEKQPKATNYLEMSSEGYKERMREIEKDWFN